MVVVVWDNCRARSSTVVDDCRAVDVTMEEPGAGLDAPEDAVTGTTDDVVNPPPVTVGPGAVEDDDGDAVTGVLVADVLDGSTVAVVLVVGVTVVVTSAVDDVVDDEVDDVVVVGIGRELESP